MVETRNETQFRTSGGCPLVQRVECKREAGRGRWNSVSTRAGSMVLGNRKSVSSSITKIETAVYEVGAKINGLVMCHLGSDTTSLQCSQRVVRSVCVFVCPKLSVLSSSQPFAIRS